jgi:RHS repeat-associated protein
MKPFLVCLLLLSGIAAFANKGGKKAAVKKTAKEQPALADSLWYTLGGLAKVDSSAAYDGNKPIDTTGMGEYGMRIYDPRMGRYMMVDPGRQGQRPQNNPYKSFEKPKAVKPKG